MSHNYALATTPWDRFFNNCPATTFTLQEQESLSYLDNGDAKLELAVPGYCSEDVTLVPRQEC